MKFKPFEFVGFEEGQVFIHERCGTVVDTVPGSDTWNDMQRGMCDCETYGKWLRIYVQNEGEASD